MKKAAANKPREASGQSTAAAKRKAAATRSTTRAKKPPRQGARRKRTPPPGTTEPLVTAANAHRLRTMATHGRGLARAVCWPRDERVVVATSVGLDLLRLVPPREEHDQLLDAETAVVTEVHLPLGDVAALACMVEGKLGAVGVASGGVHIVDLDSHRSLRRLAARYPRHLAFTGDGRWLIGSDRAEDDDGAWSDVLTIWRVSDGKLTHTIRPAAQVRSMACSPDGMHLATLGYDGRAELWQVDTWERLTSWQHERGRVVFAPSGDLFATATGRLQRRRADSWHPLPGIAGFEDDLDSLAFAPDGELMATGGSSRICVVTPSGGLQSFFDGRGAGATRLPSFELAFAPDGQTLAAVSEREVLFLDPFSGELLLQLPQYGLDFGSGVALCPDGRRLVVGEEETANVYECGAGRWSTTARLERTGGGLRVHEVAASPDGALIAVSYVLRENCLVLFDARTGVPRATFEGGGDLVECLAFSPDGTLLAGGDEDALHLWPTDVVGTQHGAGARLATPAVEALAFSPDGSRLLAASHNRATLWQRHGAVWRRAWEQPCEGGFARAASFSPDGALCAAHDRILRSSDGATVNIFAERHRWGGWGFSPDGTLFFDGARTVGLWRVADWTLVGELAGHTKPLDALRLSPDGRCIVTASRDGTLRLWIPREEDDHG